MGENLSTFFGGIGQGIDPTTGGTIRDAGGWFEFWYDWTPQLHSHVGYSVDEPNKHDLDTVGERSYNQFYFGNLLYDVTKNFLVGVEVSSWKTLYVGEQEGEQRPHRIRGEVRVLCGETGRWGRGTRENDEGGMKNDELPERGIHPHIHPQHLARPHRRPTARELLGGTTTPQLTMNWQACSKVMFRSMHSLLRTMIVQPVTGSGE